MNPTVLTLLALVSSNFIKAEIERLDAIAKPWKHTTYEENLFKGLTDHDIKSLFRPKEGERAFAYNALQNYPKVSQNFDSRTEWPQCIHPIRNQENCGATWAHSAAEVFSDRVCI